MNELKTGMACMALLLIAAAAGCSDGSLPPTTETPKVDPQVVEQGIEKSRDLGNSRYMRGRSR